MEVVVVSKGRLGMESMMILAILELNFFVKDITSRITLPTMQLRDGRYSVLSLLFAGIRRYL
jgi:hypothetical protein